MTKNREQDLNHIFDRIGKMAETVWQEAIGKTRAGAPDSTTIAKVEARYDEALETAIALRGHIARAEEMAQLRAEQAELAMRAGEEDLARLALEEKLREEAACEHYRTQYAICQDTCLALADQLHRLRSGHVAEDVQPPRGGLHGADARDTWRELEVTGRELGREALQGLRIAGRLSKETLKEAGGNLQQELRALRSKLQHDWQHEQSSREERDPRDKK
ncbi:PspA/IM30 family protein [Paenibacillus pectinilyticus]|nr:hypothetical protein [Paenibacillus pectinilyticus]